MKKKILSVILASVMCLTSLVTAEALTGSPVVSISAEAASYKTGTYKVTHKNGVNVRKGAGTKYSKVGASAKGTTFTVTKTKNANGYTWGYTDSIKCTNGKKSGWVVLQYCSYQPDPTKPAEISFKGVTFPSSITKGKGQHLAGTISSTQNITKIRATVSNSSKTVMEYTVKPGSKSYALYDSNLDWSLSFGTLSEGDYVLAYHVTSGSSTQSINMMFTVKGVESVKPDTSYAESTTENSISSVAKAKDIFIHQTPQHCTAAAAAMLLKNYLRINETSDWESINERTFRTSSWEPYDTWRGGLLTDICFERPGCSYDGLKMKQYRLSGSASEKKEKIQEVLKTHPEGVVLYGDNSLGMHAIYMSSDMKILDPWYDDGGKYRELSQSANDCSDSWGEITDYWVIVH